MNARLFSGGHVAQRGTGAKPIMHRERIILNA
jgi:hypothetical protein